VIAGKDHNRVVPQAKFVDDLQQSSDVQVDLIHIAQVLTHRLIQVSSDL